MKKGLVLILLIVYGFSTVGATLNFEYCCGKLEKVNSIPVKAKSCCNAAMKKKMEKSGCRNHKTVDLKIKDEQIAAPAYVFTPGFAPALISQQNHFANLVPVKIQKFVPEVFAPPPHQNNLLSFVCSFRI
jgi:hypothetical protein